jgi:hypothetical protein
MGITFTDDVPAAVERIKASTYTPEDLALAASVLKSWMAAGVQKDYEAARAAHQGVSDAHPYVATAEDAAKLAAEHKAAVAKAVAEGKKPPTAGNASRRLATKAGARFRTLIEHVITQVHAEKAGRVVIVTGKHPKAANAFGWAAYWAPFKEPAVRKPKAETPAS